MEPYYKDDWVTIYHGDCLDILPMLKGSKFIITSPPYNVNKEYESNNSELDFEYLIRGFLRVAALSMQGGDFLCLNLPDRHVFDEWTGMRPSMPIIWKEIASTGLFYYDKRIWKKDPAWMRDQWHSSSVKSVSECEEIYIFRKKGLSNIEKKIISTIIKARDDLKYTTKDINNHFGFVSQAQHWTTLNGQTEIPSLDNWYKLKDFLELDSSLDDEIIKYHKRIRDRLRENEWIEWGSRQIWDIRSVQKNDVHPAMFPKELPHRAIRLFSNNDQVIIDPFMGSGTTLEAGRDLNRKCIGIDKEEKYCEYAAKKFSQGVLNFAG